MSTLAYAAMTTSREKASPGTSLSQSPPGMATYVDAMAALVPAEVLSLHAVIISATTSTTAATSTTKAGTSISSFPALQSSFYGLIALSLALYVGARLIKKAWDTWDWVRMLIPPAAFVAWTMLQRMTAFDAVCPGYEQGSRTVIALFLAVVLGFAAAALAYKADQKTP